MMIQNEENRPRDREDVDPETKRAIDELLALLLAEVGS